MSKQRALRLKAWLLTLCMVISLVPTAAFAAEGKTLNYVSLGDSMSNGYGLTGYNENTSGYEGYGDGAYPNLFAEWLVENDYADTVNHSKLAMSAMRAEDLHFILEVTKSQAEAAGTYDANVWSSFPAGDKYTYDTFTKTGGRFERDGMPGTAAMADIYQSAVKKADVISLNLGSANFGVFLMENIAAAFDGFGGLIEVNAVQHDWMSMLNGCDDTTKSRLQALVDEIKPVITSRLSSLGDAAEPMMDAILYTVVSYLVNYQGVMDAVMDKNDDAHVILIGLTDAAAGMDLTFSVEGNSVPLNALMSLMVKTINAYVASIPAVKYPTAHFYYAEAANVDSLVETFATAIDGDNVIRERFVETIVGATGDGVIWSMASDMLENMDLGEVDAKLVPVTLAEIEAYEDAVANSKVDFLKDNYIDYIVGDDEDKKEEATNKLLSLAFYLSIESAIVAASTDNALDLNALKSLVTGDIKDTFKPLVDAVEKSTSEDNDDLIYELIIAVVNGITISDIEINGEPFEFTLNLNKADVEALVKNEGTDAVYLKMIAQAINQKFPNISEEVAASAVTDIRNGVIDSEAVCKLAEEWVKGEKHEVKFDGETFQVELDLTWQEIQKLITTPANSNDADDIYRDLLASAINQKFPAIDPDLTAEDIKAFIDGDFSSDAAYKLAEQWMKDKAYDVEFDGQTYQVTPNLTWEEIKALATETGDVDSIYRKLLAAAINEKYPAIDPDLTAKDIKDFIGGDFSSDAAYKLAEQWTIGKSFDVEFDSQTYPVTPNLSWQEIKTLVTGVGDTDSIYRELVADAINQRFPNISPDITAGDISNILDNQKPDALFKLAAEWAGSETYSIPWENGTVDVTFELEYTDIKTIAENADSAAAMDVYYNMVAQVINSVYPSINPDVTGADVKAIYGAGTGVYPDKLFEIAEAAAATDPTYGQYGLSDEDIKAIVAGGEAANAVYYREAAEKLNADYFNGAAYIKDSDVAEIVTAADGVYPDKLYEIVEKQLKQDDNPANDYNVEQLKTMVAGGNKALMDAAKNDVVGANLTEVRSKASQASGELETAKKSIRNAVDGSGDNTTESVANSAKKKVGSQVTTELSKAGGKLSNAIDKAKTSVPGMIKDKLTSNDPANTDTAQAKLTAAFNKAKETVPNTINSKLTSNDPANTDTAQAKLASALKEAKTSVPGMIKDKLISDDPADTDTAQAQLNDAFAKAEETVAGKDVSGKFDLLRQLFAMDEVAAETVKKDESATLRDLLHLFGRMLIGNGLGAHPSASGHAALLNAMTNAKTVQEELKQNIGVLMLGMGGLLVKFGTDILGIALDTDTIKGYLNDLPAAAEALMQALDEKFKDYETSKNTLNNAISALEAKLDVLTARLEKLSVMLEGKQQELSDAFKMAANANNKAADTAVKNLKAVVQDLATLITETRTAITTTKQMLTEAKTQLAALENAMVELKNAVATLKNGVDGMNALLTNVNTTIDKFVTAYKTASDTVMNGIDAVKVAYDKSEDALEKARGYAVKATNKAEEIYDGMYKTLADLYDALPADMALVLFGAVGGGAYVTLELTKATLVPYAEARIAEKQAELEAKAADLNAKIAEKKEALKNLSDNAAAKAQLEDEINKLETQLAALEDQINAEITDLRIGIEEANAGNLTKLKADYQKLIETITSGARSGIKDAMDDVAASAVKTTARLVTSTIEAISDAIRFVDAKIDQVVREAKNVYTEATGDEYTITENSLYVALGDSAAAAENSYVKLLAEATNADKTTKIPFANLAVANQSVGEAVDHINNNKETIAAADLITVGYGNTTFGKMAVDRANAVVKGETPAAYDWKSVVGNEGAAYVKDTINSIKSSLIAAGLNKEGDNYAEAVAAAVEAYAYASVEYLVKLPSVINAIRDINDSAKIVIVGMYNPLSGLVLNHSADGATISLEMGDYLSKLVSGMNVYGTSYAMLATRTDAKAIFVEAPAAQVAPVDGDDNVMPMDAFLAWCADGVINVAPTANGQQYIADQILGALDITDQTENLTGTVTIEGELVYDEELTALYEGNATNVDYQWYRNGEPITGATEQTYTTTAADVGKTLTVKVIGTGKYKGDTTSVGKTIDKAEYPNAADLEVTAQYGQILAEVDLPDNWTWDPADLTDDVGAAGSTNTWDAVYTPTAAEATVDGVEVYGPVVKAVTVKVEKAPVTEEIYTAPKPLEHDLTENGQTLTLVEPGTIADGYGEQVKIMYLVTEDPDYDPTEDPDADWSEVVPTATEAGTYYVWYYVDGGNNYESTDPQCIVVTVAEALATLLGDVDLDGDVDADDLTAMARHLAGIKELTDPQALRNGELDGDGEVSADDLTKLARYLAKIISSLE